MVRWGLLAPSALSAPSPLFLGLDLVWSPGIRQAAGPALRWVAESGSPAPFPFKRSVSRGGVGLDEPGCTEGA